MSQIEENQLSPEELEIEKQLAQFAAEEANKLGIGRDQYTEKVNTDFWADQREHTTIWVSGLTMAHDQLVAAALSGVGYRVQPMDAIGFHRANKAGTDLRRLAPWDERPGSSPDH